MACGGAGQRVQHTVCSKGPRNRTKGPKRPVVSRKNTRKPWRGGGIYKRDTHLLTRLFEPRAVLILEPRSWVRAYKERKFVVALATVQAVEA